MIRALVLAAALSLGCVAVRATPEGHVAFVGAAKVETCIEQPQGERICTQVSASTGFGETISATGAVVGALVQIVAALIPWK